MAEMQDSGGGFLASSSSAAGAAATADGQSADELARRKRARVDMDKPPPLDPDLAPTCVECKSTDLDMRYIEHYDVRVCWKCKEAVPEKYALLTKTEARVDYLLTDEELRATDYFPKVWRKQNPRKNTYNDMYLYLRMHVEAFAIQKWGSLDAMDQAFARREEQKGERKELRARTKLAAFRAATMYRDQQQQQSTKKNAVPAVHVHEWGQVEDGKQTCSVCQVAMEVQELDFDDFF
ncbi:DNA binding domain-containing protein [Blastocladiella britannica]|nr:DNA binding domain-containing protein [Blastocladiella britannica]